MSRARSFLVRLRQVVPALRDLAARESQVVTVEALYGRYRLVVGPEYTAQECRQRGLPRHSRPIEVAATLDHLIVDGERVSAVPEQPTVDRHLQGTVVIHGVTVHVYDLEGKGKSVACDRAPSHGIEFAEVINLGGDGATAAVEALRTSGRLTHEAYRIIQADLLRALREQRAPVQRVNLQ